MASTFAFIANDGTYIQGSYDHEREVRPEVLRALFNDGGYWYMTAPGGGIACAIEYNELAPPEANQPDGTLSQELIYHNQHEFIARIHQYLLPGEGHDSLGLPYLGGSGLPDPKELLEARVFYFRRPRRTPRF